LGRKLCLLVGVRTLLLRKPGPKYKGPKCMVKPYGGGILKIRGLGLDEKPKDEII
jgi:hypothetical protein